jgi:hypothetical protein
MRGLFESGTALRRRVAAASALVFFPNAVALGVIVSEYVQVVEAAQIYAQSEYLNILKFGLEVSLAATTAALLISGFVALRAGRVVCRPMDAALAGFEAVCSRQLYPAVCNHGLSEVGRIEEASRQMSALVDQLETCEREADYLRAQVAGGRRAVLAAVASEIGALAGSSLPLAPAISFQPIEDDLRLARRH